MFASKTSHLISSIKENSCVNEHTIVVKHALDTRYLKTYIVAHNKQKIECIPIHKGTDIFDLLKPSTHTIAIDEIQFFDSEMVHVITKLKRNGLHIYAAGLDLDYKGNPFYIMPDLMAIADHKVRLFAQCICGAKATKTCRKSSNDTLFLTGHSDIYEPKCDDCFFVSK
jgi:thymidine kinase